jgi:hypothetical protein
MSSDDDNDGLDEDQQQVITLGFLALLENLPGKKLQIAPAAIEYCQENTLRMTWSNEEGLTVWSEPTTHPGQHPEPLTPS